MRPHLCHVFPAFANGGPEVRTAQIINATADQFRHTVLSLSGELCGRHRIEANGDTRIDRVQQPRSWYGHTTSLARTLRKLRPDILLTYGWGGVDAILAGRLIGHRQIIHTEDGFLPDEANGQKLRRLVARRMLLGAASKVVCPSQTLVGIATRQWRLPARKIYYLPNGVDTYRFSPATQTQRTEIRRAMSFDEADVVIGTVGHLREEKNQARLIQAFSQLPKRLSAKLLIVGEGRLRDELTRLVQDLGLNGKVSFAGGVSNPIDYYRAMDIFALSSDTEQMPLAVLEAMSVGLPVVSTDVGDVREMVSDGNRELIIPKGDDTSYARVLGSLIRDSSRRAELGHMNRTQCTASYDVNTMLSQYRRIYSATFAGTCEMSKATPI